MKSMVKPSTVQVSESLKNTLAAEVKETVAVQTVPLRKKTFTASEMWNTHGKRKTATTMMRKWNLN